MYRAGGGIDLIMDFNAAEGDRIVLTPGMTYAITSTSSALVIAVTGSDAIGLVGVSQAQFSASWITFA